MTNTIREKTKLNSSKRKDIILADRLKVWKLLLNYNYFLK